MKAVVIGSGFGGLAAAIRLQALGYQVSLYERMGVLGGRGASFTEKGYIFDCGPTVITAPESLEELATLCGKKLSDYVELLPVEPMYRLWWDQKSVFNYAQDWEHTLQEIVRFAPEDLAGYERFFAYSKKVFDKGYTELVAVPFLHFSDMLRVAPDLLKLRAYRSVYKTVASFVKNERLRQALSFHTLLIGGNPYATSSIYTLIHYLEKKWGVFFPRGGTGALVRGLGQMFQDIGGKIHLNAAVDDILLDGKRVKGVRVSGQEVLADIVVSNADIMHTYKDLLQDGKKTRQLARKDWSMSLFLVYFGLKKTYPDLAHHTIIFGHDYKKLLDSIFKKRTISEDCALYLHAPCRTDATMAPPGCESFYVLSAVPHMTDMLDAAYWEREKEAYCDHIFDRLEATVLPGLRQSLDFVRITTPRDFEKNLMAYRGSAFSLTPSLIQSAWFRMSNKDPDYEGLYFVGAGVHPGAGVPGVVNSAKATVSVIENERT